MIRIAAAAAFFFLISGIAASASVSVPPDIEVGPGETGSTTATVDAENQSLDAVATVAAPFNVDPGNISNFNGTGNVSFTASVPEGFRPGIYDATVSFEFTNTTVLRTFQVSVPEQAAPEIVNTSFPETVSSGEENVTAVVEFRNPGNVRVDYTVSASGNLTPYLNFDRRLPLYAGVPKPYTVEYVVPADALFGHRKAVFNVTTDSNYTDFNFTVSTEVLDELPPEVKRVETPSSVMATRSAELTVRTSDNIAVASGDFTVLRTVQREKTKGNKTVTVDVNETVTTDQLTAGDDNGVWTASLPTERVDRYYVDGVVRDASGNNDTFTASYRVEPLDAVSVEKRVETPNLEVGEGGFARVGEIDGDTSAEVTLESFNQPLDAENESWTVGIQVGDDGRSHFTNVGDTIQLSDEGRLSVYVFSNVEEQFNGKLSWSGVEQHVDIPETEFYGEFKNFTQPEDQNFTIIGVTHECDATYGENITSTGWNCEYFLSAGTVPPGSTLEESMTTVTPEQYRSEVKARWQGQIAKANAAQETANKHRNYALGFAMFIFAYLVKEKYFEQEQMTMPQYPQPEDFQPKNDGET